MVSSITLAWLSVLFVFLIICAATIIARLIIYWQRLRKPCFTFTYTVESVSRPHSPVNKKPTTLTRAPNLLIPPPHYNAALRAQAPEGIGIHQDQVSTPIFEPLTQVSISHPPPLYESKGTSRSMTESLNDDQIDPIQIPSPQRNDDQRALLQSLQQIMVVPLDLTNAK